VFCLVHLFDDVVGDPAHETPGRIQGRAYPVDQVVPCKHQRVLPVAEALSKLSSTSKARISKAKQERKHKARGKEAEKAKRQRKGKALLPPPTGKELTLKK
jgi:hypothetical protein